MREGKNDIRGAKFFRRDGDDHGNEGGGRTLRKSRNSHKKLSERQG